MLKKLSLIFGVAFLGSGVLGFVPAVTPDGHLLGIFHVNLLHNIVHLVSGAVAVGAGLISDRAAKLYFQTFGVIYAATALLGFGYGNAPVLGLVANNMADTWLHAAVAAAALYIGFALNAGSVRKAAA